MLSRPAKFACKNCNRKNENSFKTYWHAAELAKCTFGPTYEERAPVQVHNDGLLAVGLEGGCVDVDVEAILVSNGGHLSDAELGAHRPIVGRVKLILVVLNFNRVLRSMGK